jgi:molybdopterin-guanine dinucleotide biosynthesis protein A
MNGQEPTGAFVLAGGRSSRMGRSKALLPFAGKPLIMHMAQLIEPVSERPTIVGPPGEYRRFGFRVVADDRRNLGPLGGICTALRVTRREWSLIVGCDLPFLTREWLEFLISRAASSPADVVIPMNERGYEPLCAMYRKRAHEAIDAAVERGVRKITDGLAKLTLARIEPEEWKAFDPHGTLFKNINTPGDYEQARRAWKPAAE